MGTTLCSIAGQRTCLMRASMRKSEQVEFVRLSGCRKVAVIAAAVAAIAATWTAKQPTWTHFVTGGRLMPVSTCCSVGQAVEPAVSCPASEGVQGGVVSGAHTYRQWGIACMFATTGRTRLGLLSMLATVRVQAGVV